MTKDKKVASIKKELISLMTYPYADPSPIPEFGRLYPYNRFDGYTDTGIEKDWEMIVMENDHLKLWISPAIGGKVWGAIEKATDKEFIYFNHAVKFRDVAMRGPWTSGGMETNMGIIGHSPSCSSPVDHVMRKNDDGSVSCFIGATDWPSRTRWTQEIRLPVQAAYFITQTSWYNNSGLEQSYYQWNNVGVKTSGNLEYINPGHMYVRHDGKHFSWPEDESGRAIACYDKNNFGEYKSYHIMGSYSDFWGCYWHNDDFGFGHYAAYDDKPGKKIWIWGLSRYGMIWEKLLTDTDGQYTEVQSGRSFNQSISASTKTPFKHNSFSPYAFDSWEEYWFPVKNIGGLTYGNAQLSFYLTEQNGVAQLNICANQYLNHIIKIEHKDKTVLVKHIILEAMQTTAFALPDEVKPIQIKLWLNNELIYNAGEQNYHLSRPAETPLAYNFDSVQAICIQAKEWERQRFYERAIEQFEVCLKKDPFYIDALTGLGGILIRQTQYYNALTLIKTALSINTYHPEANYLYGLINNRLNAVADAKDGFSIASQSQEYRSAAYTELAKIFFRERQTEKALTYLKKALQYNIKNQQALQLEVVLNRILGNTAQATQLASQILYYNPLDHLTRFELYQLGMISADDFKSGISSELPYETYLELNSFYFSLELYDAGMEVLSLSPDYAMVSIWKAYLCFLQHSPIKTDHYINTALSQKPDLVFPHREEDITVLEWAVSSYASWIFKYYLALNYIQLLQTDKALQLLLSCNKEPDFYMFYMIRSDLQAKKNAEACEADLYEAYNLAPQQWRTALRLSGYLAENNRWHEAVTIAQKAFLQHPDNYYLGLHLAKCFMHALRFQDGLTLLNKINVLPNEGASEGRNIWRETHLFAALQAINEQNWTKALQYINQARQWPEHLGVGKPYEVDERLENFLELYSLQQSNRAIPNNLTADIACYRDRFPDTPYSSNDFLSIYVLYQNNEFDKAQTMLNTWLQHNDLAAQWALAFMNGDTEKLSDIALIQPQKQEPLPYEILFEDRSFPFIKDMYHQNFFKMIYKTVI